MTTATRETITGWCSHALEDYAHCHRVCHGVYTGRGLISNGKTSEYGEITYVCTCSCHVKEVRKVERRPMASEKPAETPTAAPAVHKVPRRPVRRV